jgi:hypothetical protein
MKLQEQISRMKSMMDLNESTSKDLSELIKKGLEKSLMSKHEDLLCKVEVRHPDKREVLQGQPKYLSYGIYLHVIGGHGTEYFPQSIDVYEMYGNLMDEAWDFVYNYFGLATDVYNIKTKKCEEN